MTDPLENWKPIEGYEGLYEVSDLGRIRALRIMFGQSDRLRQQPKVLKPSLQGRPRDLRRGVSLCRDGTVNHHIKVAHLVLAAFVGPRPPGMQAAHLNGDQQDDRASNLCWATAKENMRHRNIHGRTRRKLSIDDVQKAKTLRTHDGLTYRELGRRFGVDHKTIMGALGAR